MSKNVMDLYKLRQVDKKAAHALSYANEKLVRQNIDEEGCGAVFGEFVEGWRL